MTATMRWTLVIVGCLVANALAMGFLVMASSTSRPEIIPDYYAKAAHFDSQIDQAAKNRSLGWQIDIRAGISIEVRDARGAAIDDARVHVTVRSRAGAPRTEVLAAPAGRGRYLVAHHARGLSDVAVVIERGGERFTAHATIE